MCKLQKHLIQMNSVDGGRRGEKEGFIFWLLFFQGPSAILHPVELAENLIGM